MPRALALTLAALLIWTASAAANEPPAAPTPTDKVLAWIKTYRKKPDPKRLPDAIKALSFLGQFQEPDSSGVYVGFIAGVLSRNPKDAERLMARSIPDRSEDHWVIVRAVAYSGLPNRQEILARLAPKVPTRQAMIEAFGAGKLPVLQEVGIPKGRPWYAGVKETVTWAKPPKERLLEPSPLVLDTLWGFYFATGDRWPVIAILSVLPWATERDDIDRLTLGATAKYGLANYAMRDPDLLQLIREERAKATDKTAKALDEVITAAETVEVGPLRTQAMAAINELRAKGPGSSRDIAWWGKAGQGVISLGCIAAAVTGQFQLGIPCVVGGSVASGILTYLGGQG